MISPEEIRERAGRLWSSGRALRGLLGAEALFPYLIPFRKPSAREWLDRYTELQAEAERLDAASKAHLGAGYSVAYREVEHQKLGRLRVPERVIFECAEDVASCAGQAHALRRFQALVELVRAREPRLLTWLAERPLRAIEHAAAIPRLLDVVAYFEAHPRPMRFARELSIPGVDSKFVEAHQALLCEWLEVVLPPGAMDHRVRGLSDFGFERRFGLRYEEPLIRFRWLDRSRMLAGAIIDAAVPLSQFDAYAPPCARIFVTENKVNFLTLPECADSLAVFGSGYAIDRLHRVAWMGSTPLFYWGDIDTHGFAILNRLRTRLPQTHSFLMDRDTLIEHKALWSTEPPESRYQGELPALTDEEQALYDDLRCERLGVSVRLEQERIGYAHVTRAVSSA